MVDLPTPGGPITPTTVNSVLSVKNCNAFEFLIHHRENKNQRSSSECYREEAIDVEVPGIREEVEGSDRRETGPKRCRILISAAAAPKFTRRRARHQSRLCQ